MDHRETDCLKGESWVQAALASSAIGVWRWDARSGRVEWSPEVEKLYGIPVGSFGGTYEAWSSFLPAEDLAPVETEVRRAMGHGGAYLIRHRIHRRSDGALRWVECHGQVVSVDGVAAGLIGTVMDITDRVGSEQALAESREHLRDLIGTIPAIITQVDRLGRIVFINQVVEGLDASAVNGTSAVDWVMEPHRAAFLDALKRCMAVPVTVDIELDGVGPVGTTAHYLSRLRGIWRDGVCEGAYIITTDVTERIQAQRALRESEARLRSAADSMPFTFWVRDAEGRLILQNRFSRENFGDQLGQGIEDLRLSPDMLRLAQENIRRALAGEVIRHEISTPTARGDRVFEVILAPVRDGDQVIGVLGCDLDITEQRNLEERLNRAAREESVGRLAGGVAHDFNNLLTAILGYADLALAVHHDSGRVRGALERVIEAGRRGAGLTGQLLAYARRQPASLGPVPVRALIERVSRLVQPLLGETITLTLDLSGEPGHLQADAVLLEQVLVNLTVNARDAMPSGGIIVISAERVVLGTREIAGHGEAKPGAYVRIDVRDDGDGMPPEVQSRLFEPFFTTKPVGKGTGLGLASSNGIVRQHHGFISVASQAGIGTTFSVFIPSAAEPSVEVTSDTHPAIRGDGQTILVVEDEPLIRDMVVSALVSLGYHVLAADHGEAALAISACSEGIDLVVTDLIMPRLGGGELVRRLRGDRSDLSVVYMSGYADEDARPALGPNDAFLAKPFTTAALAATVHGLLLGR